MGEAKNNRHKHEEMRSGRITCIYCGIRPTTTVDHMPPRMAFDNKQRPNVFTFPSCKACNDVTADNDTIISWFSRIYSGEKADVSPDFEKLSKEMNRFPEIGQEMRYNGPIRYARTASGLLTPTDLVSVNIGPTARKSLLQFALKYALAMHWHVSGEIVPEDAPIWVFATTNYGVMTDPNVRKLLSAFHSRQVMRQGSMTSTKQFSYQNVFVKGERRTIHFGGFRESFAVCASVYPPAASLLDRSTMRVRGDLHKPYPFD